MDSYALLLESVIIVFTMLGVVYRRRRRPLYWHALFFVFVTGLTYTTSWTSVWDVLLVMFFVIMSYSFIYQVPLDRAAVGGTTTYILFTGVQLASTFNEILMFKHMVDFRRVFEEAHGFTLFIALMTCVGIIAFYNHSVSIPRRSLGAKVTMKDPSIRMNVIIVLLIFLVVTSNLRYLYSNWSELSQISGLHINLILMTLVFGFLMLFLMMILNRYRFKNQTLGVVRQKAATDAMTGFLNREAGLQALSKQMQVTRTTRAPMTLCFVDINNLKVVNDRFGHDEGDNLIQTVAATFKQSLRDHDIVARLGGDEFIIVFAGCDMLQSRRVWSRIQESLKQLNLTGQRRYSVGVSAGFVQYDPQAHRTMEELLACADEEMYCQKRAIKGSRLAENPSIFQGKQL